MRHKVKRRDWPPDGSRTFITRFLWIPVITKNKDGEYERRWLEHVTYLAEVTHWQHALIKTPTKWTLEPKCWVDSDEQRKEVAELGYNFYHLALYDSWETGTPDQEEMRQLRRKVPPFLW